MGTFIENVQDWDQTHLTLQCHFEVSLESKLTGGKFECQIFGIDNKKGQIYTMPTKFQVWHENVMVENCRNFVMTY